MTLRYMETSYDGTKYLVCQQSLIVGISVYDSNSYKIYAMPHITIERIQIAGQFAQTYVWSVDSYKYHIIQEQHQVTVMSVGYEIVTVPMILSANHIRCVVVSTLLDGNCRRFRI